MPVAPFGPLIEQYREAFRRHGRSPDAVLCPKGRQYLRFAALTSHIRQDGFSVLDFGCGLGHLKAFLDTHFTKFRYFGVDVVPEFVAECAKLFPQATFTEIRGHADVAGEYDYTVLSGVFNILYLPDRERHMKVACDTLEHLFQLTGKALSCDFLSDQVDFQQPGAFHMSRAALLEFVRTRLSQRYVLDHSYLPYEFALTVFKDQRIVRPANVFHGLR
jgi:SAM-dependent methyltransferase